MTPKEVVEHMMNNDAFSQWLGIKVESVGLGSCKLSCVINAQMLNGHFIAHGGIAYSLADSALAFAANTYGNKCVSIETSISHLLPVRENDQLSIECSEIHRGKSVGTYSVDIHNQKQELIAKFKGTVHISDKIW